MFISAGWSGNLEVVDDIRVVVEVVVVVVCR